MFKTVGLARTAFIGTLLVACLASGGMGGCGGGESWDDSGSGSTTPGTGVDASPFVIPSNLLGRTYSMSKGKTLYYDFTGAGTMSVKEEPILGTPTGTARYTYEKTSATTASFTASYVLKLKVGFDVIYNNIELDFTLTFTSATEGEYAGTMRFEYKGDANKTSVKSVSGPFVLE